MVDNDKVKSTSITIGGTSLSALIIAFILGWITYQDINIALSVVGFAFLWGLIVFIGILPIGGFFYLSKANHIWTPNLLEWLHIPESWLTHLISGWYGFWMCIVCIISSIIAIYLVLKLLSAIFSK